MDRISFAVDELSSLLPGYLVDNRDELGAHRVYRLWDSLGKLRICRHYRPDKAQLFTGEHYRTDGAGSGLFDEHAAERRSAFTIRCRSRRKTSSVIVE